MNKLTTQEGAENDLPVEGDHYHLVPHKGSDKLLVLFSATGTKPGKFNLWKQVDDIKHNKLFLRLSQNDWYQTGIPGLGATHEDTLLAIRRLAEMCGAKTIYTCGSSMGGHGAILYGAHLGARVLAFSPETIMNLPFSKSAKMMPKNAPVVFHDLSKEITAAKAPIFLISGEMDPVDLFCAETVKDLPNMHVTTMQMAAHTVMRDLVFSDRFIPVLSAFLDEKPLPELSDSGNALQVKGYARAYFDGWESYIKNQNDKAVNLLEQAVELNPVASHPRYLLAMALLRVGRDTRASHHAAFAAALAPDNPDHRFIFAHCLRQNGYLEQALLLHRSLLEKWPDMARVHFDIGQVLSLLKRPAEAKVAYRKALELNPNNKTYRKKAG